MFWQKSWFDTRWRFLIGLAVLTCAAIAVVLAYPRLKELLPLVPQVGGGGPIGQQIREAAELIRDYRGYVWSQWFSNSPTEVGTLLAVLLGSGSLVSQGSGAALFTLSLPASRNQLLGARATTGLGEWLVLALVPSMVIPLVSPAVGANYGVGDALVHGVCQFVAGAVFFSLALLLSTVFTDLWRPMLLALAAAVVLAIVEQLFRGLSGYGVFALMSGELYFRTGQLPWGALAISVSASAAMLYGASKSFARRDF